MWQGKAQQLQREKACGGGGRLTLVPKPTRFQTHALLQVQDTVLQLDFSPAAGSECSAPQPQGGAMRGRAEQQAAAEQLVPVVWEVNKLRSMLAAVVLQWATCLQEGAAGSHAAPPSGAGMLSSMLATRRQAGGRHSRQGSMVGEEGEASELPLSPTGLAAEQQRAAGLQQQQAHAQQLAQPPALLEQPEEAGQPSGRATPALHMLQRSVSGASLGQQFLEAGTSLGVRGQAASELDFGAPSLVAGDEGGGGGGGTGLATSPQAPASIPTGLVARYVAMFDQRGYEAGSASPDASPATSPTARPCRSQRTLTWVQASSPAAGQASAPPADAAAGVAEPERGVGPAADGSPAPQLAQRQGEAAAVGQQPLVRQRSSLFRLDLTSPSPDLARALTPSRRRSSGGRREAGPSCQVPSCLTKGGLSAMAWPGAAPHLQPVHPPLLPSPCRRRGGSAWDGGQPA